MKGMTMDLTIEEINEKAEREQMEYIHKNELADLRGELSILKDEIHRLKSRKVELDTIDRHARALCAHVEAMGMQAENQIRTQKRKILAYGEGHFDAIIKKWGLVDKNGAPVK